MSVRIYHNPRCSKSRQTLKLIEDSGIQPEVILYLDRPPSTRELEGLLKKLGMAPKELMRKGEDVYKELGLAKKELTKKEAIQLLHEHPKLIERPIVVKGDNAILGRPPENVLGLL
ncbi:MAG: arsenate reductase (glutaredoxin) [Planctomycetaceae bacterium]|nr:arsenate reductase (glutaredoxin) [Planctomycetaceae bacterium]MCB9952645.1 arsenate reductase (glutaredoxin) [Planctomycetaceae bacterium]